MGNYTGCLLRAGAIRMSIGTRSGPAVWLAVALVTFTLSSAQTAGSGVRLQADRVDGHGEWLDRPLEPWHRAGAAVPPSGKQATSDAAIKTCALGTPASATQADAAVARAGWVPFLHQDRATTRGDVEVIAGLTGVTTLCEPVGFNLFVFVGNRFAGTLSPGPMTAHHDGAIGAVRLATDDRLTAEFERYAPGDSDCCPSSRVRVTYRIDRGATPMVQATSVEKLR